MGREKLSTAEKRLSNYYCDDEEEEKLRNGTWQPKTKKKSAKTKSLLLNYESFKERF